MTRYASRVRSVLAGLACAGALGFGTAHALASPAPRAAQPSCDALCNRVCRAAGFIGGFCGDGVSCNCYL